MRLAFLFSQDVAHEWRAYRAGDVPAHRLFGAAHVEELGHDLRDYSWPRRLPSFARHRLVWRLQLAARVLLEQRSLDAVVCTTETPSQALLVLKRLRLVRLPVLVLTVAALAPVNTKGWRRILNGWLWRGADVVYCYASAQVPMFVDAFRVRPERVRFLPFGVDVDFFDNRVDGVAIGVPHVLAVGTNAGKDLPTLMVALPEGASCTVVSDPCNITAARAAGAPDCVVFREAVPIRELRELYRSATHVVIPLKDASASSGQTVLLENLVDGRSVLVSDVPGIRDYLDRTAAITFPAGDIEALRRLLMLPMPIPASEEAVEVARARYDSRRVTRRLIADATALNG